MSDDIMGNLEKMVESQVAERLGENQIEEMAQQAGLGGASGMIAKAASGLFGGHAAHPQAEEGEAEEAEPNADEETEPEQENEEPEPKNEDENE